MADRSLSPLSGVDKWSWLQTIPSQRVAEDLGCCSRAHSVLGAVAVPDIVRSIDCKIFLVQTEPLEKRQQLPEMVQGMFSSGSLCQPNWLSLPIAMAASSCRQALDVAEKVVFRTEVFQYWLFNQSLWYESQAWPELARGKISYHLSNALEQITISVTKVIMQTGLAYF